MCVVSLHPWAEYCTGRIFGYLTKYNLSDFWFLLNLSIFGKKYILISEFCFVSFFWGFKYPNLDLFVFLVLSNYILDIEQLIPMSGQNPVIFTNQTLQMMLLKLNKEGPFKKEVFRAPGHQGSMRKLIHFLQQVNPVTKYWQETTLFLQGRLVNIQNYSLNTIASVLKKFLRKIPGGIFGPANEAALFNMINMEDQQEQIKAVNR